MDMDFAMLPPEVNSGRLYGGPGPASLAGAVAPWDRLAAQLRTAAAGCHAVASTLLARSQGPAARQTAASVAAHAEWLRTTATLCAEAAAHAAAAVRAHETALAATVPPLVVGANRTRRISLAVNNVLGQTSASLAETEADYDRMWAQDAAAMCAYARACADASTLTLFASPPPLRGNGSGAWRLQSAPEVVATARRVTTAIPGALRARSRSPLASFDVYLAPVTASLSRLSSLTAPSGVAISHLNALNKAAALRHLLPGTTGTCGARLGRAVSVGALSVPPAWFAAAMPAPVYQGTVAG